MRQRQHRLCRTPDRRRNTGDDVHRYTGGPASLNLFAAATENESISTLQPHDLMPGLRLAHENRVDTVLRHGMVRTTFGN